MDKSRFKALYQKDFFKISYVETKTILLLFIVTEISAVFMFRMHFNYSVTTHNHLSLADSCNNSPMCDSNYLFFD